MYLGEAHKLLGMTDSLVVYPLSYAKPLYSGLLSLSLWLGSNRIIFAQSLQVLCAACWVPILFFLTLRVSGRELLAWGAASLCVFDPWIFLYSRHLFADPLATLFWMASLYPILKEKLRWRDHFFSGLLFGLSCVTNYRMIIFSPTMVLFFFIAQQTKIERKMGEIFFWFVAASFPMVLCHLIYELFRSPSNMSYAQQLGFQFSRHSSSPLQFHSLHTYFTLIHFYEGYCGEGFIILGFFDLLWRELKKPVGKLLVCTYGISILGLSFFYFQYARVWSPLLFWHPLLSIFGIQFLSRWIAERSFFQEKFLFVVLTGLLMVTFLPRVLAIQKTSIPYREAVSWIQSKKASNVRLFTSLPSLIRQLVPLGWDVQPTGNPITNLKILAEEGVDYFLVDANQFVRGYHSIVSERADAYFVIHQLCQPALLFSCQSPKTFWTIFAWEHNVNSSETEHFLKNINTEDFPCLEVYDLQSCVRKYP